MIDESVKFLDGEADLDDQYISVLLELYLTEEETQGYGPLGRRKVGYWRKIVRTFEQLFPEDAVKKAAAQARRAQKQGLDPVQTALVRFAWLKAELNDAGPREVRRRWMDYFAPQACEPSNVVVSLESFRQRRHVDNRIRSIAAAGLWPWARKEDSSGGELVRLAFLDHAATPPRSGG